MSEVSKDWLLTELWICCFQFQYQTSQRFALCPYVLECLPQFDLVWKIYLHCFALESHLCFHQFLYLGPFDHWRSALRWNESHPSSIWRLCVSSKFVVMSVVFLQLVDHLVPTSCIRRHTVYRERLGCISVHRLVIVPCDALSLFPYAVHSAVTCWYVMVGHRHFPS